MWNHHTKTNPFGNQQTFVLIYVCETWQIRLNILYTLVANLDTFFFLSVRKTTVSFTIHLFDCCHVCENRKEAKNDGYNTSDKKLSPTLVQYSFIYSISKEQISTVQRFTWFGRISFFQLHYVIAGMTTYRKSDVLTV